MRRERGYRVPVATLRELAASDVHLDVADDAREEFFDESWLQDLGAGVTSAISREDGACRADALKRLSRRITGLLGISLAGWTALERQGLAQFAPILAQIEDLAGWPQADRDALAQIVRARWAPQERGFVAHMRAHERLRDALRLAAGR